MISLNFKTSLFAIVLLLIGSTGFSQSPVVVYGELRAIMQRGDLSAKVSLDTMNFTPSTIGLGVASGLKGEIIIVEGKPYISYLKNGKVVTEQSNDIKAAMLVTSDLIPKRTISEGVVMERRESHALTDISSMADFEYILDKVVVAEKELTSPFGFSLKVFSENLVYHIIDWAEGVEHTPDNHKQFAVKGKITNEEVMIIGFYSEKPGIFTPHSSKIHLHVYHPKTGVVGHVDEINIKSAVLTIY
jgi:acetolactate decarboxylase